MKTTYIRKAWAAAFLMAVVALPAALQAQTPPDPARRTQQPAPPAPVTAGRRWSAWATASNVFESNVDRAQDAQKADGLVLGLTGQFQSRAVRPSTVIQYQVGLHQYAGTDRWDRVSHNVRATYERRMGSSFTVEGVTELAIKGSSEDRELGNQLILSPRLQYRLTRRLRLGVDSGYRIKRYEDVTRNAWNPYLGPRVSWRFGQNGRLDATYRYEENHATGERNRYKRFTYGSELLVPLTGVDRVGFEVKFRTRTYERTVRVGSARVPLTDDKLTLSPEWLHALTPRLHLRVSYEFETRDANDPDRLYDAHAFVVGVERRW